MAAGFKPFFPGVSLHQLDKNLMFVRNSTIWWLTFLTCPSRTSWDTLNPELTSSRRRFSQVAQSWFTGNPIRILDLINIVLLASLAVRQWWSRISWENWDCRCSMQWHIHAKNGQLYSRTQDSKSSCSNMRSIFARTTRRIWSNIMRRKSKR